MKNIISIALITLTPAFFSYTYAEESIGHGHTDATTVTTLMDNLRLNNGVKWNMDQHTRIMSKKMESTFYDADHSSQAGLNSLGLKLKTQSEELITGCTMQGKSHDQLHIFLTDHLPTISALIEAEDYATAKVAAVQLKGQFETYKKYFK